MALPYELDYLLSGLAATPTVLRRLLAGAGQGRPAGDEGWTPKEVVAHLRDAEEMTLGRYRQIVAEEGALLKAYDQEALARERQYGQTDLTEALAAFEQLRDQSLHVLSVLDEAGWQRAGRHEERGRQTLQQLASTTAFHDLLHLRQITESLSESTSF
ncbi:MAG: DinB family protein [Dehalococcoidia bacterium]